MFLFNKNYIRNKILKIRNNLKKDKHIKLRNQIAQKFIKYILPYINQNATIAIYYPYGSELNILPFINTLINPLALPKMEKQTKLLKFYLWKITDELVPSNIFSKILEPCNNSKEIIPDILIIPLIACDKAGNRLGSGQGMYDATITKLRSINKKLLCIGICYDFQLIEKIPYESHDEKLDIILTENRFILRKSLH